MKAILSIVFIFMLIMMTVHCSSSNTGRINKRFYDAFDTPDESVVNHPKGFNREDPCENKPLWFLKSQRKLGKLSPFYNCLTGHNID